MTRLAFAGKCGAFGSSGSTDGSAPTRFRNPTMPKPAPITLSTSRRVIFIIRSPTLVHPLEFIRIQQHSGIFVPVALGDESQAQLQFLRLGLSAIQHTI